VKATTAKRFSGEVVVEVSFDETNHKISPVGAYRAIVRIESRVLEALTIGIPKALERDVVSVIAFDEIARTALCFALADHPEAEVDRDGFGNVVVGRRAIRRGSLGRVGRGVAAPVRVEELSQLSVDDARGDTSL
jgi:hypothetical protein